MKNLQEKKAKDVTGKTEGVEYEAGEDERQKCLSSGTEGSIFELHGAVLNHLQLFRSQRNLLQKNDQV